MLAHREGTYGVDTGFAAGDIVECRNVVYKTQQAQFRDDRISGINYPRPDIPGARWGTISGEVLIRGRGVTYSTSADDGIEARTIFTALGMIGNVTTSAGVEWAYTPDSSQIGQSASLAVMAENAPNGKLLGAFGTGRVRTAAGEPAVLAFTLTGMYQSPATTGLITAIPSPLTPGTFKAANILVSTSSHAPQVNSMDMDIGNEVMTFESANDNNGAIGGVIIGMRRPSITLDPLQVSTTDYDWHAKRDAPGNNGLGDSLQYTVGQLSYNRITIKAPRFQVLDISDGVRGGLKVFNIAGKLNAATSQSELEIRFNASS